MCTEKACSPDSWRKQSAAGSRQASQAKVPREPIVTALEPYLAEIKAANG